MNRYREYYYKLIDQKMDVTDADRLKVIQFKIEWCDMMATKLHINEHRTTQLRRY